MSSFWERKLAQQQGTPAPAPAPQPQAPQPASNGPWWRSTPTGPAQVQTVPQEPSQGQPETDMVKTLQAQQKQDQMDRCPGCGSGNYAAPPGSRTYGARCFDCGYPVQQSTSGMSNTASDGGPSTPARQVSTANNYNPQDVRAGNVG